MFLNAAVVLFVSQALSCKAKAVLVLQGVLKKVWTGLVIQKRSSS